MKKSRTLCCLLAALQLTTMAVQAADTPAAVTSTMPVILDGTQVSPLGYNINGNNYYKLRDVAYLLADTESRFAVDWNDSARTIAITLFDDYVATGEEMQGATETTLTVVDANTTMLCDGAVIAPTGYNINGNTYFKLRDLGDLFGFSVGYDETTQTVYINTPPEQSALQDHEAEQGGDAVEDTDDATLPTYDRVDGELIIVLDAGHGGDEPGTVGTATTTFTMPDGTVVQAGTSIEEKTFNRFVADYLQELLEEAGVTVRQTREDDETLNAADRQDVIRELAYDADMLFSIHHNAATNTEATGAEVLVQIAYADGGAGMDFAAILEAEYTAMGQNIRKTVCKASSDDETVDYYFVLRAAAEVDALAFISEFCFLSNTEDQAWVQTEEKLRLQAQAQFDAIMTYFEDVAY